ncbi:hypothetical protein Aperf_G00000004618 [Anoplocephala perfoliata]
MERHHCCNSDCHPFAQTFQEMEFDRGIWSCAIYDKQDRLLHLLQRGADVNEQDKFGYTALHYAARNGRLEICNILLKNGADITIATRSGGATALHRAAFSGHLDIVKLLCSYAKDDIASLLDSDGQTCLHSAARGKQSSVYQWLLSEHPELYPITDKNNETAEDFLQH